MSYSLEEREALSKAMRGRGVMGVEHCKNAGIRVKRQPAPGDSPPLYSTPWGCELAEHEAEKGLEKGQGPVPGHLFSK